MPKCYQYVIIIFCILFSASYAQTESVTYEHKNIFGASVDVITINLNDPHILVTPVIAKNFPQRPERFESMVAREEPVAAINGNFFCKTTYKPVGDIVINGDLVHFGGLGTAMGITKNNRVEYITVEKDHHMDWSRYRSLISCGPRLIDNGEIVVNARAEGFSDPNLFTKRNRSAVGVTWDGALLFVTVNNGVYFSGLAGIMKELGCRDAMNLDGGGSSALYFKGENLSCASTPMPDILVVHEKAVTPNILLTLGDRFSTANEKRIEILSSLAMVINKDQILVKGLKDGKIWLLMRFEEPNNVDMPQLNAKFDTVGNRIMFQLPLVRTIQ